MGWAIKQVDGTYRCWNANSQDDILQPGEVWVALSSPPPFVVSKPTNPLKALIQIALADASVPPSLKAVLSVWMAQL